MSERFAAHKTLVVTLRDETVDLVGYGEVVDVTGPKVTLRVPRAETAVITARLLGEQSVEDLTVEDPPIEDVIELAFASGRRRHDRRPRPRRRPAESGRLRSYAALYLTIGAGVDARAVPVPRRELLLHDRHGHRAGGLSRRVVDDRRSQGGSVGGYTAETFAAYYIVWTLVRNMNIVFTPFGWEERIREGTLSGQLVRPMHPIHYDLGFFAGWKVVVIVLWLPIAAVLTLIFDPELDPRPQQIAVFFVAIWGAYLIRSFLLWMLGMVTFWTTRVSALFEVYFAAELLLSGRVLPLALDAGVGAGPRLLPAVPMDVRLPDHRARRADLGPRAVPRSPGPGGVDRRRRARRAVDVAARRPQVHGGGRMRLAWLFLRVGVMNELHYRANFFIQLLQSLVAIAHRARSCWP